VDALPHAPANGPWPGNAARGPAFSRIVKEQFPPGEK